jgi:hypothetical protein
MRSIRRKRYLSVGFCAVIGAASSAARAVVVWGGTGYNNATLTPAPGNLQNFEGQLYGGYTGTPISSNFMISATHVIAGPTESFVYDNGTGIPTTYTMDEVATEDDMALWEIAPNSGLSFSTFTPVYTGSSEWNSQIVDVGRGYARGNPVYNSLNQLQGWDWGGNNGPFSWGENTISSIDWGTPGTAMGGDFLQFDFLNNPTNPNECILTEYDSGGGAFIGVDVNGNTVYELAGVNTGVDLVYTDSQGKDPVYASLFNTNGYYAPTDMGTYTLVSNGASENSYVTRLSTKANLISLADGAISSANAAQYPIDDDGQVVVVSKLTTGAITGEPALQVGNAAQSGSLQIAPNSGASWVQSLTVYTASTLDITNNQLTIDYGASDPIATIVGYLQTGYNNGHWNGTGIISSTAQAPVGGHNYGVGYADGSDHVVAGLSSGQIEIRYTLLGDANLDGVVNGSDFSILASDFGMGDTRWDQGDFNYGTSVNGTDFTDLAANFGQGIAGITVSASDIAALDAFAAANGLTADLPEPACGALLVATAMAIASRRSRTTL